MSGGRALEPKWEPKDLDANSSSATNFLCDVKQIT